MDAIRFSGLGAKTLTIAANLLTGGLLVSPDVGANNVTINVTTNNTGNSLQTMNTSDICVWQNNTSGSLIISAPEVLHQHRQPYQEWSGRPRAQFDHEYP